MSRGTFVNFNTCRAMSIGYIFPCHPLCIVAANISSGQLNEIMIFAPTRLGKLSVPISRQEALDVFLGPDSNQYVRTTMCFPANMQHNPGQ